MKRTKTLVITIDPCISINTLYQLHYFDKNNQWESTQFALTELKLKEQLSYLRILDTYKNAKILKPRNLKLKSK